MFGSLRQLSQRLPLVLSSSLSTPLCSSIASFSSPKFFSTSAAPQKVLALNELQDVPGARTKKLRKGRGPGTGKGKTATRGHKGSWARGRYGKPGFEGGQTPISRRYPKRGFTNIFARPSEPLNLGKLVDFIQKGRINANETITLKTLYDSGILSKIEFGVKILGVGASKLTFPINLEVTDISENARQAIEACGGSVKLVYYNDTALRALLKPEKFEFLPRGTGLPKTKYLKKYGFKTQDDIINYIAQTSTTPITVNPLYRPSRQEVKKQQKIAEKLAAVQSSEANQQAQ